MLVKSGKNISLVLHIVFLLVIARHFSFTVQAATLPEQLSSDVIAKFIEDESIESVEEFIKALPSLYKRHFLLVFTSEALNTEFVSNDNPRVISWGADARFIITWSTNPNGPSYQSVEFLENQDDGWSPGVIDFSSSSPEISSPATCKTCHGSSGKPLFGKAPTWRGTEEPDSFNSFSENSPHVEPLRNAMQSTDERLASLDFSNAPFKAGYRRHIKLAEETYTDSAVSDFYYLLSWRQGEIMFNDFIRREQNDQIDFVDDFLCKSAYDHRVELRRDHNFRAHYPGVRADNLGRVHGTSSSLDGNWPTYGDGDSVQVILFLYLHHLWQTDDRIRELYRSSSNKELFWQPSQYEYQIALKSMNNYEFGTATSEDELIYAYNQFFVYRGQNFLDARLKSFGVPADDTGRILERHTQKAVPYVCRILNGGGVSRKSFWVADSFASEAAEEIVFDVVLGQNNNPPAVVYYSTEDMTATNGEDYTGMTGSISFRSGDKEKRLVIPLIHDNLNEDTETFLLKLTDAQGITLDTAKGNIKQSSTNQLAVSFRKTSYDVAEGASVEVIVDLKGRNAGRNAYIPLKKYHSGSTISDYSGVPEGLAFLSSDTESSFTLTATNDSEEDGGESVELRFGSLPRDVIVGSPATAKTRLNIVGSDSSTVSENNTPNAEAGSGGSFVAGSLVTLDGSGSADSDGSIVLYSWTQTKGESLTLSNAGVGKVNFTAPSTGPSQTLIFLLTVEDDHGASDTDTVSIEITDPPAPPKVTDPPAPPKVTDPPAPPKVTDPPAPPKVTDPPAPPKVTDPPAPPKVTDPPAPPKVTDPPAPPKVTDPPAPPKVTDPPAPPKVTDPPAPPKVTDPPAPASSGGCMIASENTEDLQKSSLFNLLLLLTTLFPKVLRKTSLRELARISHKA